MMLRGLILKLWIVAFLLLVGCVESDLREPGLPISEGNLSLNMATVSDDYPRGVVAATVDRAPVKTGNSSGYEAPLQVLGDGSTAYGVNLVGNDVLTFTLDDAANPVLLGSSNNRNYYAGDFLGSNYATLYAIDNDTQVLYAIDTGNGAQSAVGSSVPSAGQTWTGMAGDPVSGNMYVVSSDCNNNTLYTLEVNTGAVTQVGTVSGFCIIL